MNLDAHKALITKMGSENRTFDSIAFAVNQEFPRVNCTKLQIKSYFEKECGVAANIERHKLILKEKKGLK